MIQIQNLSKKYDKRGIAGLNSINFELDEGKIMALMGPNGSGKTTLLKILCGEIQHDEGHTRINGTIAYFPRTENLEDQNVQKFLIEKVSLDISNEKKIQLARDLADTFEFTFQLRQNLSELSSGQRQKILLASELINRPALLLMDEPFSHLDPFTRKDILQGLFHYIRHQKITLLWVTHELDEALKFSDFVGILNFGKLEQLETPENLIRFPRNLFVAQFIGQKNFLPVSFKKNMWQTPWGERNFNSKILKEEALLVIPPEAWIINESGIKGKVEQRWATQHGMEYQITIENRQYILRASQHQVFDLGSSLQLIPLWETCFLIPL